MDVRTEFKIPYLGLKDGLHEFDFEIGKAFFTSFDRPDIEKADIKLRASLDKKTTMMVAVFDFEGTLDLPCARCNDDVDQFVEGNERIVYKFGQQEDIDDESIISVPPHLGEIDLSPQVFEIIMVSIPLRVVHEDSKDCNQEVMNKLKELKPKVNINPQWEALRKLKSE